MFEPSVQRHKSREQSRQSRERSRSRGDATVTDEKQTSDGDVRVFVFAAKQEGSTSPKKENSQDRTSSIIKNEDYSRKHNQIQIENLK